jgi:hypothetical protein
MVDVLPEVPGSTECLLVPDFGDTTLYWGKLIDRPHFSLRWPGIWGEPQARHPYSVLVAQLDALMSSRTVIAHSLGARAALEAASYTTPKLLIALAPALGSLPLLSGGELDRWAVSGTRRTTRPDPETNEATDFDVPYAFAADLVAHGATPSVKCQTRFVLFSEEDGPRNDAIAAYVTHLAPATTELVHIDGPRRFWNSTTASAQVVRLVSDWCG